MNNAQNKTLKSNAAKLAKDNADFQQALKSKRLQQVALGNARKNQMIALRNGDLALADAIAVTFGL